jgi:hypothetical protein
MDENFRLIANPYLLNTKPSNLTDMKTYESQLKKIIELEYNIYIHPQLIEKIKINIDNEINNYIIDKYVNDLIDDCIEQTIQNLI